MDEITISASLSLKSGAIERAMRKLGLKFTQTGADYTEKTQIVGITEEALVLGEVGTPGYILIVNLDPTNFVSIRAGTGLANAIRLDAKEGLALFKFGSGAAIPFAIADTAPCIVVYLLLEA